MSDAFPPADAATQPARRILVIRPDRIGDVVLATPVIRALRQAFPSAFLAAMVRPATEPVLRGNPHLDEILIDDPEGVHAGRRGFFDRRRALRLRRFDTALMLLPTERHAWMTALAGIRTRIGVGTKLYQVLTCTRGVSRRKYIPLRHEADYCLDLVRALGVTTPGSAAEDLRTEVFLSEEERAMARERLRSAGRDTSRALVSVHPESGHSAPNWTLPMYRDFVVALREHIPEAQVLIPASPGNAEVRTLFGDLPADGIVLPESGDLRFLMGMIAEARVVVSASTGPMHLAAALGIPTVSLFCPLTACSPVLWGPQGNHAVTLLPPDEYCRTQCPGDPHICTLAGGITAEAVIAAVRPLL
ncbi:MAG: glycosyltransferase family 9 protein [Bacteroidota bacterium]|jgi:heptosyltransferase-2|nr:glycosyltransferase family 9 protein [Bacteroidota bacterium]